MVVSRGAPRLLLPLPPINVYCFVALCIVQHWLITLHGCGFGLCRVPLIGTGTLVSRPPWT